MGRFRDFLKKAKAEIHKDIEKGKTIVHSLEHKAHLVLEKAKTMIKEDAKFAVLLPLLPSMVVILSVRGVNVKGKGLGEIVRTFYSVVLGGHHYESYEIANLEEGETVEKKGFDESNTIGKLAGTSLTAAGVPPEIGTKIGGTVESIIKGIIGFFKNLKKKKEEGTATKEEKLALEKMDQTEKDMTSPTTESTSTNADGVNSGKSFNIGGIEIPKMVAYIGGLVVLYIIAKKTNLI
jgi:hypothetical protein